MYINIACLIITVWLYNLALTGDFEYLKKDRMSPLITKNPLVVYSAKFLSTGNATEAFTINSTVVPETKEFTTEELGVDTNKAFYSDPSFFFFNVFAVIAPVILVVLSLAGGGPILVLTAINAPPFLISLVGVFWGLIVMESIISLFRG